MTEELAVYEPPKTDLELSTGNEMYFDIAKFEQAQRVAKMLASSTMVPEHFRNNVGNCMIGLNFASRVGLDPFMVLQKMYIIHGRPGIESQLMIALINNSGRFTPLKYRITGKGKTLSCTCYATEIKTGENCEQTVNWAMVEAEGWHAKKGSKWKTLPELMMQYRSAAFFGRLYCPEALLGLHTKEELLDIQPQPQAIANLSDKLKAIPDKETVETKVIEPEIVEDDELYNTPEHKEWREIKELFPDITGTLPEPTTIEHCVRAVKQIKQTVDSQNK